MFAKHPLIQILPPMRCICYRAISHNPEVEAIRKLEIWLTDQPLRYTPRRFGFDVEIPPAQQQEGLRGFETWWTIPEDLSPGSELEVHFFPGGMYAVLCLELPFHQDLLRAPAGWKQLHEWVIQSGRYCTGSHQWLEEWIPHKHGGTLKLYHPVTMVPSEKSRG